MSWFHRVFLSSVGKKFWMGITGVLLCLFIAFHLTANLLFFLGPDPFNGLSAALEKIPILLILELKLAALFALHILLGIVLYFDNRGARGDRYVEYGTKKGGVSTTVSKTMIFSGLVVLIYIVLHVRAFVFGGIPESNGHADYYAKNLEVFSNGIYCLWYVFGVAVLAFHISHGFQSAFRSIGLNHRVYTPVIEWVSRAAGVIVGFGFASIPLYVFFFQGA
ncbi:MAG: succinate dehydrogenase cytochrome b subunit [Candidatus Eisenbacteria bacterium]